jgi:hypothetical protein
MALRKATQEEISAIKSVPATPVNATQQSQPVQSQKYSKLRAVSIDDIKRVSDTKQIKTDAIEQQKQERISQGLPVSVREDRAEPTFGGKVLRAPLKLASTIASTIVPASRALAGEEDVYRPIKSDYLGDVYSPGGKTIQKIDQGTFIDPNKSVGQNVGRAFGQAAKGTLGVAATGAEAASYAVGGGALPNLGKQALLKFAGQEALAGGLGAFGSSAQNAVDNAKTVKEGLGNIVKDTAIGTGVGVLGGGLIGGASKLPSALRKITPDSETIMNRVARLNPSDARKFEQLAGKSHGKYLEETGNFGRPDEIVKNEVSKFAQSKIDVDNALEKLPGTYKTKEISDVIIPLEDRMTRVQSPEAGRITQLRNKLNTEGLDMSEINEIKRLYERNVKLAYNKLNNADAVELATNLDNRLRDWQVKQADMLGFENIREMNKQTQLARFISDKLGNQLIGKSGLDGMNLTDWIMLSGGDPTSVGGLITKKFFSDPGIQSKIAQYLSKSEKALPIKPKLGETKLLRLEAPKGSTVSSRGSGSIIPVAPKGANMEFTGQVGGIIPEKPSLQLLKGKLVKKASMPKASTKIPLKSNDLSTDKGMIATAIENLKNPATRKRGSIDISGLSKKEVPSVSYSNDTMESLLKEAKKYNSAEEFAKSQEKIGNTGNTFAGQSIFESFPSVYTKNATTGSKYKTADEFIDNGFNLVANNREFKLTSFENAEGFRNAPKVFKKGDETYAFIKKPFNKLGKKEQWELRGTNVTEDGGKTFFKPEPEVMGTGKTKSQLTDIWNKANKK